MRFSKTRIGSEYYYLKYCRVVQRQNLLVTGGMLIHIHESSCNVRSSVGGDGASKHWVPLFISIMHSGLQKDGNEKSRPMDKR